MSAEADARATLRVERCERWDAAVRSAPHPMRHQLVGLRAAVQRLALRHPTAYAAAWEPPTPAELAFGRELQGALRPMVHSFECAAAQHDLEHAPSLGALVLSTSTFWAVARRAAASLECVTIEGERGAADGPHGAVAVRCAGAPGLLCTADGQPVLPCCAVAVRPGAPLRALCCRCGRIAPDAVICRCGEHTACPACADACDADCDRALEAHAVACAALQAVATFPFTSVCFANEAGAPTSIPAPLSDMLRGGIGRLPTLSFRGLTEDQACRSAESLPRFASEVAKVALRSAVRAGPKRRRTA